MSSSAPAVERMLRSLWTDMSLGMSWTLVPDRLRLIRDAVMMLVHENNALRRNNERLTQRTVIQEGMLHAASLRAAEAEKRAATAQTMAEHWRLKVEGGDYDATREGE